MIRRLKRASKVSPQAKRIRAAAEAWANACRVMDSLIGWSRSVEHDFIEIVRASERIGLTR